MKREYELSATRNYLVARLLPRALSITSLEVIEKVRAGSVCSSAAMVCYDHDFFRSFAATGLFDLLS